MRQDTINSTGTRYDEIFHGKRIIRRINNELQRIYPEHHYISYGRKGGTILYEAIKNEQRSTLILPGFICAGLSAMVKEARKRIVHIDIDPCTMQMRIDLLYDFLDKNDAFDTFLLIDHSFGYINPYIVEIKKKYPELLIIEDCVRAFGGRYGNKAVGTCSDWILHSMYKTVSGNHHGAVLLSKNQIGYEAQNKYHTSLVEFLANNRIIRYLYKIKKVRNKKNPFGSGPTYNDNISFAEDYGIPSSLILKRYLSTLKDRERHIKIRDTAWEQLKKKMVELENSITLVDEIEGTIPSKYFMSFVFKDAYQNDKFILEFLWSLQKKGFELLKLWSSPPCYFKCFDDSYLYGNTNTKYLAHNLIHIPINNYLHEKHQDNFIYHFKTLLYTAT